jgi:hypothetical protein
MLGVAAPIAGPRKPSCTPNLAHFFNIHSDRSTPVNPIPIKPKKITMSTQRSNTSLASSVSATLPRLSSSSEQTSVSHSCNYHKFQS